MFKSYDSERNVIAIGTTENKIPALIFNREGNSLSVDTLSEKSKNPHDAVVSNHGHPATGDKFSTLDKGFRLTKS